MRFSIRTLLSIVPSFVVSMGVGILVFGSNPFANAGWARAARTVGHLKFAVDVGVRREPNWSLEEINRWLTGDQTSRGLASLVGEAELDPWNRPYRCIERKQDHRSRDRFGIYSSGEDGVSKSDGNDPDDINSWDRSTSYYHPEFFAQQLAWNFAIGVLLTPFIHAFLGWAWQQTIGRWVRPKASAFPDL